nr:MAG TPA: Baseplate wedge protein [Caudoviricetes sp.]
MGIIDDDKLQNILPKYSELKLSGKNLAQQYVSAFNTGMNIYQCINQLQGYIEWVIKAVDDVVVQWNDVVDSQIQDSINATKQATTEQFNIEWQKNKTQLDAEIEGIIQDQFNQDWQEKENAINTKINVVSTDLATFKTETNTTLSQNQTAFNNFKEETDTKFTSTKEELTELINTTLDSIYPVGSVYISLTSANPGDYLKGTWEQFAQGRTLIGVGEGSDGTNTQSFAVNDTGGEYKHLISKKELSIIDYGALLQQNGSTIGVHAHGPGESGSEKTSLMQPYYTVYFWKRVS